MALIGGNKQTDPTPAPVKATVPATPPAPPAAPATPKTRGRKPGTKSKELVLDLDGLVVRPVTNPQEMAKARRIRGERSDAQKRLDAMVEQAWKDWKAAGEPTEWPKMPGVELTIAESRFESLQAGVRKAGQYLDLRVRFGKVKKDGNGNVEVVFVVTDKLNGSNEDSDD